MLLKEDGSCTTNYQQRCDAIIEEMGGACRNCDIEREFDVVLSTRPGQSKVKVVCKAVLGRQCPVLTDSHELCRRRSQYLEQLRQYQVRSTAQRSGASGQVRPTAA